MGADTLKAAPIWVGRQALIAELSPSLDSQEDLPKVVALLGQGGIGKTALAAKLLETIGVDLRQRCLRDTSRYDRVVCLRLTDSTGFAEIARDLLPEAEAAQAEHPDVLLRQVMTLLNQHCVLLVLDNVEVALYPAGQAQAGQAKDEMLGRFLNEFAYGTHRSRLLLTSRELPRDLCRSRTSQAPPNAKVVKVKQVDGLSVDESVAMLREYGLEDSEADLRWVAEQTGGNALILYQLASYAAGKPGLLRQRPDLVTEEVGPILQEQLERQGEAAQALLRRMSILQEAVDLRGLTFVRLYEDSWQEDGRLEEAAATNQPMSFPQKELKETEGLVKALVRCSLVEERYDRKEFKETFSLHQLIRECLVTSSREGWPELFQYVYDFRREGELPSLLNPVIEAQKVKQLDNITQLSLTNITQFSLYAGEQHEFIKGCELLVKTLVRYQHGDDLLRVVRQTLAAQGESECIALLVVGKSHYEMSDWNQAEILFQEALEIANRERNQEYIAGAIGLLGCIQIEKGNWEKAERLFRNHLEMMEELGDRSGMTTSWGSLGDIEANQGNWDEAERLFRQSLKLRKELDDSSGMATSIGCLSKIELGRGNLDKAEELLTDALQQMQTLGMTWHIGGTNFDLAQLHRAKNNLDLAQTHYATAHQLFTQLGAAKDLEHIEKVWEGTS